MRWALRVAPSSGNLQTTEVHLVLPPLEGLAPVTAAQLGFNGNEEFPVENWNHPHHMAQLCRTDLVNVRN